MDIDRRLHNAGQRWRQSQGPALRAPKLDTPPKKTPPRRWMTGLIPLAASAAVAAMVIGVVILHGAPTGHPVPEGSMSTSSSMKSPPHRGAVASRYGSDSRARRLSSLGIGAVTQLTKKQTEATQPASPSWTY